MFSKWNCRQCGGRLDLLEFGPEKICPHCGKETAPVNIKELHVNFSTTIYGEPGRLPRKAKHRFLSGVDYLNVCFRLELSMGDISSPPESNSFAYTHQHSSCESAELDIENYKERLSLAPDDAPVYLWINEREVNAYLNLLKFSDLFERFHDVYLIRCCSEEDMRKNNYEPNDSFENKTRITREMLDAMATEYRSILKKGGEFRVGSYGDVRICSEEYLESFVKNQITDKYVDFNLIYIKVREAFEKATGYIIDYHMVTELTWRLMTKGQIRSRGPCEWWGDPSYNNMLITQGFRLRAQKVKAYTYEDALNTLRDAFKFGRTRPLYDVIADNAALKFDEDADILYGRDKIIRYIEDYGSFRVNVNEDKVFCDVLRIAEGERYGIGDLCLLLCYESKNAKKVRFVIKVLFLEGQIQAIKIFAALSSLRLTSIKG